MRLTTQPANNENRKRANIKLQSIPVVVFTLILVLASSGYAQPKVERLLQSGLYQEEIKGDLDKAIKIYERIVINFPNNRPIVAKALLHIGMCKEKLGRKEAINAYQKVVELYPEQTEPAAIAREKLEMLARLNTLDSEGDSRFRMRRVCEASGWWKGCSVSPNGRFFAFSDRKNDFGEVSIYDLSSGTIRRLTNDANQTEGAYECVVSPDGEQIAYCWINNSNGTQELRLVGTDGYRPKTLYRDKDGLPITPFDWSPDGKEILVFHKGIAMVSVDDGSVRVLKNISPRLLGKVNMRISPDGLYIAYDLLKKGDITHKDIYILATDGSIDAPLIEQSSNDVLLDWYPDGKNLLFRSDRTGDWDAWRIRVKGGKPYGTAELVKKDLGSISLLGFTRDGSFYFKSSMGGMDIYTTKIDLSKGKIVDGPKKPIERGVGGNVSATWSPDGKYLAYIAGGSIHIRSEETGKEKEISPQPGFYGIEWFPDGSSLKVYGEDKEGNRGLFRVDTKTGAVETLLMQTPEVHLHRCYLGPEGRNIYYKSYRDSDNLTSIFAYNIRSKQKKKIWHGNGKIGGPAPSPDGQWLAMEIYQADGSGSDLAVMPINGGEIRELAESSSGGEFVWTPDSKELLFAKFVAGSGWGSSRQELWIVPLSGGAPKSLNLESRMMWLLTMHPDGEQIAYTSDKDKAEIWVMENFLPKEEAAQRPTFRKINIASKPQNGVLSPDGNRLAFMSDDAVWVVPLHGKVDPDIAGEPVRLAEVPGIWDASGMMAWSADGKWIAVYDQFTSNRPGGVRVIPVAGGKPRVVQLPKQGSGLWSYGLSLSPDGQILAFSALELGTRHEVPGSPDRYIYTIPTAGGEPKQVSSDWARMPSFSSDGEFIAYVGYRKREAWQRYRGISRFHGDLWVVPSAGGTPVKLASVDGRLEGPVWSPDGKYIAAHNGSNEIWVFPLSPDASSAGEPEKIALPRSSWRNMLAGWTPDNELGVFISTEQQCAIYTVPASGGRAVQISPPGGSPRYPRWSPDGERIYFRGRLGKEDKAPIVYVPSEGGDPVQVPPVQLERRLVSRVPNGGHNVSPDGKRIVISTSNGIWTIPLDGGLPTRLTSGESFEGLYPCWSPNGRTIAFTEWNSKYEDEVFFTIYVIPADGGEISQITSEADRVGGGAIAFSPDGERIAFFSGGAIKTIPIEGGQRQVLVTDVKSGPHSIFRQLAYSPDGSKIAHNAVGKIWITSLDGGEPEELRTGLPENAKLIDFGWSPDGEKIAFIALIGGEEEFWLIENFLPETEPKVKAVRQVWDYAKMGGRGNMGRPSPDGRYLLYADMKSINVCALEFATKKTHFITNEKVPWSISDNPSKKPVEFHWGGSIWSPDGKKVAYSWRKFKNAFVFKDAWDQKQNLKDSFRELRTTGLDGSNTRVLYSDDNLLQVKPLDWSSDGKHILAELIREDTNRQLVMVSVADGSVRVLKKFDKLPRGDGLRIGDLFSPDGRHVVFESWQEDSSKRDIHILSTDGNGEAVLVEHPADDFILGWTPDGEYLIFASDRTGTMGIWAIRVSEGRPQGDTVLIKKDMGAIWPKGFDKNGSFYYASETKVSDVYMAEINFETNGTLSKPKRASELFVGSAMYPDWSPDGKYLSYISYTEKAGQYFSNPVLCIRSLENGEERGIYPELGYIGGTCWSPDGRFILTVGKKEGQKGFYKIDVKTGKLASILQLNKRGGAGVPVCSQDGRKIFYMHTDPQQEIARIIMYDLATKEKKEIYRGNFQHSYAAGRPPLFAQELSLSPDGQFLAFKTSKINLKIIPISGGEAREVIRWNKGRIITTADWTPDGKELIFAESKFQRGYKSNFWRISVEGGEPQKLGLPMDRVYFLRIHPDGQHIAFRAGQRLKEIYAMENFLPETIIGE